MRNLRLDICYDGTRYLGWQRLNGHGNTIQGKLETTLSRILDEKIEISGSGRTDAGVHAVGQVANFHTSSDMPCDTLLEELRRYLPEDIGIYSCKEVSDRFHARLNARRKTYLYRIWNSAEPCVLQRRFVHVLPQQLDLDRMRQAAGQFLGEHDFSAFCSNARYQKSTIRRIDQLTVSREGDVVCIRATGDGFLYNMVRILAGTLVEVGLGQREPDSIAALFGAKREDAGVTLPGKGLFLVEVEY